MLDNYLIVDTENNGALRNKAHPFDPRNKLLLVGLRGDGRNHIYDIEYSDDPYGPAIRAIRGAIASRSLLVGFNIKYDLHWLRRYNVPIEEVKVWDCQLAEFLLSNQLWQYPDLHAACDLRQVAAKKDILKEYLAKGIDVDQIPLDELTEYLEGDLLSTDELLLKQIDLLKAYGLWNLFRLQCQDLVTLADKEYNGMKYDFEKSQALATDCAKKEQAIEIAMAQFLPPEIAPYFNWGSGDHVSALLYGGRVTFEWTIPNGIYKTGIKTGQQRNKWVSLDYVFPRLVEPLKGSEVKKDGFFKTDIDTLKGVKAKGIAKAIIEASLELSGSSKLRGTYYEGIPKKSKYFGWEDNLIHGQLNQCVAVTGRLSSSNPNLQNNSSEVKECFVTRYE